MRPKVMLVSVLVASLVGLGAADGLAARDKEVKTKLSLYPCFPVDEDDAGGEAEFESDRGLKVEIWGATLYRGETLAIEVDGQRIGTLTVGEDGKGEASNLLFDKQEPLGEVGVLDVYEDKVLSSLFELC